MTITAWEIVLDPIPATHTPTKVLNPGEISKTEGRLYPPVNIQTDQNG